MKDEKWGPVSWGNVVPAAGVQTKALDDLMVWAAAVAA